MKLSIHLLTIGMMLSLAVRALADSHDEELSNKLATEEAKKRLNKEIFWNRKKAMRNEFVRVSQNEELTVFLVRVTSDSDRKVFRTVRGSVPSDAVSYIEDWLPPGIYLVGIARPSASDAFLRSSATKSYTVQVSANSKDEDQKFMKADLPGLLKMQNAEQDGGGQRATRPESK